MRSSSAGRRGSSTVARGIALGKVPDKPAGTVSRAFGIASPKWRSSTAPWSDVAQSGRETHTRSWALQSKRAADRAQRDVFEYP